MVFRFNIQKTIQAIAALLHFHESKEMSYLRMPELLYLADRESLKETGRPITGDRVVAMEHRPALSSVYDLIKGEHTGWPVWSGFLGKKWYRIERLQDPGNGALSKYALGFRVAYQPCLALCGLTQEDSGRRGSVGVDVARPRRHSYRTRVDRVLNSPNGTIRVVIVFCG
jgi:Protein of unknown function (DUF4065)